MINKNLQGYSPSLKKMLLRMISTDPEKRPGLEELFITPDFLEARVFCDEGLKKKPVLKRKLSL